ncbi:hypothetical protein DFH29DRAFT_1007062 [Suillus ampliporus]|nr:hypothetical protein DFH29DRAFT_1007062 [Suillus ampliporus]
MAAVHGPIVPTYPPPFWNTQSVPHSHMGYNPAPICKFNTLDVSFYHSGIYLEWELRFCPYAFVWAPLSITEACLPSKFHLHHTADNPKHTLAKLFDIEVPSLNRVAANSTGHTACIISVSLPPGLPKHEPVPVPLPSKHKMFTSASLAVW